MTYALKWGFKTRAEALALEIRGELGIEELGRFDPRQLAEHLAIPVCSLRDLATNGADPASIRQLVRVSPGDFSALTIVVGTFRGIVENAAHAESRRTNSLAHELSHIILEHEPGPAFDGAGSRKWTDEDEAEADWLAGALLVPRPVAVHIARMKTPVEVAALQYGVSIKLMTWRLNQTGAILQAQRGLKFRVR